jgi:flagellar motor switch protein FliN/FliY
MTVSVEMGRVRVTLETLLNMTEGSLLGLDREPNGPVDVRVNGELFARGQVVVVNENFGVRLTEIVKD